MMSQTCNVTDLIPKECYNCGHEFYEHCTSQKNCTACVEDFAASGGCECMGAPGCDLSAHIKPECYSCAIELYGHCGSQQNCTKCVSEFAASGGCECMWNPSCNETTLIPHGCSNLCGLQAWDYCNAEGGKLPFV